MKALLIVVLTVIVTSGSSCRERRPQEITLSGAVMRRDADPNKQSPIAGVQIAADYGTGTAVTSSSVQGAFTITLPATLVRITPVTLRFRHAGYEPLDELVTMAQALYVIRMTPLPQPVRPAGGPAVAISNVSIRYAAKVAVSAEVGTRVKTFQVVNQGNLPCNRASGPCSPDGRWRAGVATLTLDAEQGNSFRNARLSCIAGPCPFTRIVRSNFAAGGQTIRATVLDWSDTATFLAQAEVVHPMMSENVRRSYPVIFDRTLNFSLPAPAEGVCVEAEMGGQPIVFPLGPSLNMSWAACQEEKQQENVSLYRCELKAGYEFR